MTESLVIELTTALGCCMASNLLETDEGGDIT